jgi:hypothetical protein
MLEHQVLFYVADLLLSWRPSTKIEHKRGIQNILLDAARARGRRSGRPKAIQKIEPRNLLRAKELYAAKKNTIQEIMHMTGFKSRNTFYKYIWRVHPQRGGQLDDVGDVGLVHHQ